MATGVAMLLVAGCASSGLPRGARWVGGGVAIEYDAPRDGTVILIERTSRRILVTESLSQGDEFQFRPGYGSSDEVLLRVFGPPGADGVAAGMPTNTFLDLYFVPAQ